jgi:hypothetical protein
MTTPKEKAVELSNKFYFISSFFSDLEDAKECALIAVDEILKVVSFYNDTQAEITYWEEVKREIEKL